MKKFLPMLLIFSLLLPLAACGVTPSEPLPTLPTEPDPTRPPDGVATDYPAPAEPAAEPAPGFESLPEPEPVAPPQPPVVPRRYDERPTAELLAAPTYPERPQLPQQSDYFAVGTVGGEQDAYEKFNADYSVWLKSMNDRRALGTGTGLDDFFRKAAPVIVGENPENVVFSPLNLYLALSMLAEVTDGNTRAQLLDLLGAHDVEALRAQAEALWQMNYSDDGLTTTLLASSFWLSDRVNYVQSTLDTLAGSYYASAFRGTMGSPEYTKLLQKWLNEQTGGLLQEAAGKQEFDTATVLALATTVYFKARWSSAFPEAATMEEIFHTAYGYVKCDFMHRSAADTYYWGEGFGAVKCPFESSDCAMWLILPDEGVNLYTLLKDGSALELALSDKWENRKHLRINLSVPKFDVSSDLDLIGSLKELGITDAFDPYRSDFTPLVTDFDGLCVDKVSHAARIKADEEGCEAAAFTVIMTKATAAMPPQEEMDFVLDRPFLAIVTGVNNTPLFVAAVQTPVE